MTNATKNDAKIHKGMTVREVIALVPAAADIMMEYGLHCFSCSVGGVETLEEGCRIHSFDNDTIDALVEDINDAIGKAPKRPQDLTVTAEAARSIAAIAKDQKREEEILVVTVDEQGGFCLEFQKKPLKGDMEFCAKEEPAIKVYASVLTLSRIGGAVIDVREGRFKLDLPEDCCQGEKKDCACT